MSIFSLVVIFACFYFLFFLALIISILNVASGSLSTIRWVWSPGSPSVLAPTTPTSFLRWSGRTNIDSVRAWKAIIQILSFYFLQNFFL